MVPHAVAIVNILCILRGRVPFLSVKTKLHAFPLKLDVTLTVTVSEACMRMTLALTGAPPVGPPAVLHEGMLLIVKNCFDSAVVA